MRLKNFSSAITIGGQLLVARTVVNRLRDARRDGDRMELLDALLNIAVLVTGTIVIVRQLRKGEEA